MKGTEMTDVWIWYGWCLSVTYQTTRGSGQPLTVQCRRTHCFSHTVWERGLITNSGVCIRLSSFMRLKCSSCSWIYKQSSSLALNHSGQLYLCQTQPNVYGIQNAQLKQRHTKIQQHPTKSLYRTCNIYAHFNMSFKCDCVSFIMSYE